MTIIHWTEKAKRLAKKHDLESEGVEGGDIEHILLDRPDVNSVTITENSGRKIRWFMNHEGWVDAEVHLR